MESRQRELADIKSYIEGIDKEVTMILQSLQWDRKHLLEGGPKVSCSYDAGHRVPPDKKEEHERECCVRRQGYSKEDKLLPEPFDENADTLVKFCKEDIMKIIDDASKKDPMFKKGAGCPGPEPLTFERLQATYTADEWRAIHDAAVSAAPACHDLTDLALIGSTDDSKSSKPKSRVEVLAELRDMRRRRTKYRVSGAANTKNYSHVLRDVIKTQMELYSVTHASDTTEKTISQTVNEKNKDSTPTTTPTQNKYIENRERFRDNEHYTGMESNNKEQRKKYDAYNETDRSSEHRNSRGNHKTRHDTDNDRHDKYYSREDKNYKDHDDRHKKQYRRGDKYGERGDHDRPGSKDKQTRSQSKERNRRDDKYRTNIVIKEELDTRDRHRDYYESKRDKYSRNHHGDYYKSGSGSSSANNKRRHTRDDYGNERKREDREKLEPKYDRKRRRKDSSEKRSEAHYKRYYDTVDVKQEIDSS